MDRPQRRALANTAVRTGLRRPGALAGLEARWPLLEEVEHGP